MYLNRQELISLQKKDRSYLRSAIMKLSETNPTETRLVPTMSGKVLRIKLVDSFDGIDGHLVKFGSWQYLFSLESKSFIESPGILVSCWWKCPSLTRPRISYKECRHWINCYGKGFGARHSTGCVGLNVYTDDEGVLSHRPHPGIWTDEKEVHLHQYHNQNFEFPLMRSLLEKRLHLLTKRAREKAHAVHRDMMELIDGSCTKRIVTTGSAIRRHGKPLNQWGPYHFYSFSNEVHVDDCDLMTRFVLKQFMSLADNAYKRKILSFPKICLPTTCAYQFSWRSLSDSVNYALRQFFVMDGLGLAMPLEDGIAHHFLASIFSHHTSTAELRHPNGDVSLGDEDPIVLVFAWGNSGGPKNVVATHGSRGVAEVSEDVSGSVEEVSDEVARPIEDGSEEVSGPMEEVSDEVAGPIEHGSEEVARPMEDGSEEVSGPIEEVSEEVAGPIEHGSEEVAGPIEEVSEEVAGPIEEVSEEVAGPIEEVSEEVAAPVEEVSEDAAGPIEDDCEEVVGPVEEVSEEVAGPIEDDSDDVAGPVEEASEDAAGPIEDDSEEVAGPIKEVSEEVAGPIEEVSEEVAGPVEEVSEDAAGPIEDDCEEVVGPVEEVSEEVARPIEDDLCLSHRRTAVAVREPNVGLPSSLLLHERTGPPDRSRVATRSMLEVPTANQIPRRTSGVEVQRQARRRKRTMRRRLESLSEKYKRRRKKS